MPKVKLSTDDPLSNPKFKKAGLLEELFTGLLDIQRPLDCVQVEVTSHCIGKCVYCPHTTQGANWKSLHMDANVFARIWPLLKRSTRAHLQGWGEPLLHPRFFDFVRFAIKAGCNVSTTTCGITINAETAEKIAESGMDMIAFSLTGTDGETNKARANLSFKKVCDNIRLLREKAKQKPLQIHLAYLLLADQMKAVTALPQLMDELDVDMAVISTLDYLALPEHSQLGIAPHEKDKIRKAYDILSEAALKANKSGRAIYFALPGETTDYAGGCRENINKCLYINAEGFVSPCVYLNVYGNTDRHCDYGNVLTNDPLKIWNEKDYIAFRENLLHKQPPEVCLTCPKRFEVQAEITRPEPE